jgi:hypothetical protein
MQMTKPLQWWSRLVVVAIIFVSTQAGWNFFLLLRSLHVPRRRCLVWHAGLCCRNVDCLYATADASNGDGNKYCCYSPGTLPNFNSGTCSCGTENCGNYHVCCDIDFLSHIDCLGSPVIRSSSSACPTWGQGGSDISVTVGSNKYCCPIGTVQADSDPTNIACHWAGRFLFVAYLSSSVSKLLTA